MIESGETLEKGCVFQMIKVTTKKRGSEKWPSPHAYQKPGRLRHLAKKPLVVNQQCQRHNLPTTCNRISFE